MNLDIIDRFSQHLRNALARAVDSAFELRIPQITPLLLLWSLSQEKSSVAAQVLTKQKLTTDMLRLSLDLPKTAQTSEIPWPEFTPAAKRMLEKAAVIAFERKHTYIGTEHALDSLLTLQDPAITRVLQSHHIAVQQLRKKLDSILSNTSRFSEVTTPFQPTTKTTQEPSAPESDTPALDHFGTTLTDSTTQQKIDGVVGRAQELERVYHILARRTKNNPLLIGEPGVGKTAIVEGLAKRIALGHVPQILRGKRVVSLDIGVLVAGSMYRGEFEARIKQIIEEVKTHPEVILFIDEIHTIIGAGGTGPNSLDAANMLKPALARGDIHCIGATTFSEYQKHIESDPALARRFQPILVAEPSEDEAEHIVQGVKKAYEQFHHVQLTDAAIKGAVHLSARYMTDRALPDKAIDIIDEAAAQKRVSVTPHPLMQQIEDLRFAIQSIKQKKIEAVSQERFEEAVRLKTTQGELVNTLAAKRKQAGSQIPREVVDLADIQSVVARMTHIPLESLQHTERTRLVTLQKSLEAQVIGQPDAIRQVAAAIKRSRVGLQSPDRPLGSFLFLGPSGVGKTELARQLAQHVCGSADNLIKIDMSEFNESFTVTKLIGAPAGYVGFKDGAKLTDQVRRKPYSVVLFDEIEKAHPDIFNVLLQVLDEGHLTDASGRTINFRNTIIILTSNIGLEQFNKTAAIGFEEDSQRGAQERAFVAVERDIKQQLKDVFRLEFLNRLDHIIVFKPLMLSAVERIVSICFADLAARVKAQGVRMQLSAQARHWLAQHAFSPEQGARLVARTLQEHVEHPLADLLLEEKVKIRGLVRVEVVKNKLVLRVA